MTEIKEAILQQLPCIQYPFDSGKRPVGLDVHNGFDSHDSHNSHDKFSVPGQVGKGLIFPENLLLADASMVFHLWQCKHTGYVRTTYTAADNQAGRTLQCKEIGGGPRGDDDKSLCGSTSEAKNVHPSR